MTESNVVNKEIIERYIVAAKEIESRFRVPCSVVVKDQNTQKSIPWITTSTNTALFIFVSEKKNRKLRKLVTM
jgi:hypothetical protein